MYIYTERERERDTERERERERERIYVRNYYKVNQLLSVTQNGRNS